MSPIDLAFYILVDCLAVGFLATSLFKRTFRRHWSLNLYAAGLLLCDGVRSVFLRYYGVSSPKYFYAYYSSDLCLVVLRYAVILSVFGLILRNSPLRVPARRAFLGFFALVAGMSYAFVSHNWSSPYSRLVFEFQQNLYFACVLLTVLLCATLTQLRVTDPVLRTFVYGLGVSAALLASGNALQSVLSALQLRGMINKAVWDSLAVLVGRMHALATLSMLTLWCYALTHAKVGESATESAEIPEAEEAPSFALMPAFLRAEVRS